MSDCSGFITMFRKITEWEWYGDPVTSRVFIHLLLTVNWKDARFRGIKVARGSRITGRIQLSAETNLSQQNIRTAIKNLELTSELTRDKTSAGTVFTVVNYDKYQLANHQTNHASTTSQPRANHEPTTSQPQPNHNRTKITREQRNKENKSVYRSFAHLSLSILDSEKLIAEFGKPKLDETLDKIENFKNNTKYKSLYLTAKNWLRSDANKNVPPSIKDNPFDPITEIDAYDSFKAGLIDKDRNNIPHKPMLR